MKEYNITTNNKFFCENIKITITNNFIEQCQPQVMDFLNIIKEFVNNPCDLFNNKNELVNFTIINFNNDDNANNRQCYNFCISDQHIIANILDCELFSILGVSLPITLEPVDKLGKINNYKMFFRVSCSEKFYL